MRPITMNISRRQFIQLSGISLATLPLLAHGNLAFAQGQEPALTPRDVDSLDVQPARRAFGRAIVSGVAVRELPSMSSPLVRLLNANEVITISGQVNTAGPAKHNPIWYRTTDGWAHSANLQPSDNVVNTPLKELASDSQWGDITVPVTALRAQPGATSRVTRSLFFGMVFRITALRSDAEGVAWYLLADGNTGNIGYVLAAHIRPLTEDYFVPISPDVPLSRKRIVVDRQTQTTTAYEDGVPVFSARVATGGRYRTPNGTRDFFTVPGEHRVFRKIAGQLMAGGTTGFDGYYLPGIGWVSYFTGSGIAFHATYWHNDFGARRSHGCVNMLPEDAHWIFRWTMPSYPATARQHLLVNRSEGTLVEVL